VFSIGAPIDEARSEPTLAPGSAVAGLPPLSPSRSPLAVDSERRREPAIPIASIATPGSPPPPERGRPVGSDLRKRPFGAIGSLVLHLLPLLLLLDWPMHPPAEVTPIPVQLVFEAPPPPPPPPPKPAPKPQLKPETRPPPGRIASENMGDTQTKGRDQAKSDEPSRDKEAAATMESPLEAPLKEAAIVPPPPLPVPPDLSLPKPPEPKAALAPKPPPKRSPAMRQPVRRAPEWARLSPRPARFPGPAASRDEYLAYLAALARQHIGLLTHSLLDGRRGETVINVLVLDDGTVAMLSVGQSSGYPDIDVRVEEMIRAVGRFPPLPQWFQGPSMRLEFRLQFPEALDD
jgi:periplasmic protein TonB